MLIFMGTFDLLLILFAFHIFCWITTGRGFIARIRRGGTNILAEKKEESKEILDKIEDVKKQVEITDKINNDAQLLKDQQDIKLNLDVKK